MELSAVTPRTADEWLRNWDGYCECHGAPDPFAASIREMALAGSIPTVVYILVEEFEREFNYPYSEGQDYFWWGIPVKAV